MTTEVWRVKIKIPTLHYLAEWNCSAVCIPDISFVMPYATWHPVYSAVSNPSSGLFKNAIWHPDQSAVSNPTSRLCCSKQPQIPFIHLNAIWHPVSTWHLIFAAVCNSTFCWFWHPTNMQMKPLSVYVLTALLSFIALLGRSTVLSMLSKSMLSCSKS